MISVDLQQQGHPCACFVLCSFLLMGSGCSRHAESPPQKQTPTDIILATVGEENITVGQFSAELANHQTTDDPKARKALLDNIIHVRVLAMEARRRGYDRDPQIVSAYSNLLADRMREEIREQAKVSPQEVEKYYAAHQAEFTNPTAIRAAVIFVAAPTQMPAGAREERRMTIDSARQKALELPLSTVGFGDLATQYSDDQETKFHGGDMGYFVEGYAAKRWDKSVLDTAFALTIPHPLSDVITTDRGYYLVRLTAKHDASPRPLSVVRSQIEKHLIDEKERQLTTEITKSASGRQFIKVYDERLAAVHAPKPIARQATKTLPSPPGK